LDFDTRKPRIVDTIHYPHTMPHREDRSDAGEILRIRETVEDTDINHKYLSSFVDIDTNKHTNNIAYLRMILNCFSPDEFNEHLPTKSSFLFIQAAGLAYHHDAVVYIIKGALRPCISSRASVHPPAACFFSNRWLYILGGIWIGTVGQFPPLDHGIRSVHWLSYKRSCEIYVEQADLWEKNLKKKQEKRMKRKHKRKS